MSVREDGPPYLNYVIRFSMSLYESMCKKPVSALFYCPMITHREVAVNPQRVFLRVIEK